VALIIVGTSDCKNGVRAYVNRLAKDDTGNQQVPLNVLVLSADNGVSVSFHLEDEQLDKLLESLETIYAHTQADRMTADKQDTPLPREWAGI